MHRVFRRLVVPIALSLTLAGTVAPAAPAAAGTAWCDIKLAVLDGPQVDDSLTVRVWEDLLVYGYGFPSVQAMTVSFHTVGTDQDFEVTTDEAGEFVASFYAESGSEGSWTVDETADAALPCYDVVSLEVIAAHPFGDVTGNPFEREIAWLFRSGITGGCASDRYCPDGTVTREQMASFLARAFGLPVAAVDYFNDDETSIHEGDINRVAQAGITKGCAVDRYCPGVGVTRAQMASFLARAFDLPAATQDYFSDDNGSPHEGDINRVAEAGITRGCSATSYCPDSLVTRAQMAAFLYRALS